MPTGSNAPTLPAARRHHPHAVPLPGDEPRADVRPGDIAVGVVIGRASEYFDFFVYGLASVLVFPAVFFPDLSRLEGTLAAFVLFAAAFVVRPLGTAAGMAIERRFDRGTKLTVALFLLGSATAGMALLPRANSVGMPLAVGLLALCRLAQGFATGASWDGLPSLLAINAPPQRRGWYAMLGQLGAPLGFFIACGLFAYLWSALPPVDFLAWGWRYPFFVAFAINVVALFARLRLVLTHEYERELMARELEPAPVGELLREQGRNVFVGAFAPLASYALFHIVTVFPLSWVMLHAPDSVDGYLTMELVGAVLAALAMPVSGLVADRVGRRRTLGLLAVAIGVFALCAPMLLDAGRTGQDAFIVAGFVLLGLSYGQAAGPVSSHFWPRLRYTGAALTADFAWLIGAAFAPYVALWLASRFGLVAVGLYLLSAVACTLFALRLNRRFQNEGRPGEGRPGEGLARASERR
jgi:MFS family permease